MSARRVHFMGIGGVGMAGLAALLKSSGCDVSGCDLHSSPRTKWLEGLGIRVSIGHDAAHVEDADELVITPAVPGDSPELEKAVVSGVPTRRRGELLAEIVSSRESIAVCGSHGKTTTATFIAKLLVALGEKTGWVIGGETGSFPVAGFVPGRDAGEGDGVLVAEADESDGTLALYHATTLVVTNCEYDHPDHFRTKEEYLACFNAARRNAGSVVESSELDAVKELDVFRRLDAIESLAGHNRRNALTAAFVALRRGHPVESVAAALPGVVKELPDRRFERLAPGVYTDYAHHPTEMKCAVSMARAVCSGTLRVLFQPHRHSRTRALLKEFPASFDGADEVILCPTYAAFENPVEGGDVADLYAECRQAGVKGLHLARSCMEAWHHASATMKEGDLTLLLGAGDIIELAPLARDFIIGSAPAVQTELWIGAGTNTWQSDLVTGEVYRKSESPAGRSGSTLGIPWMAGIPGTIGGWVKMNAGAFGHSISEVLRRVKVDGEWRDAKDCGFGYRTSSIEGEIQDIELVDDKDLFGDVPAAGYLARRKKFPPRTNGSVFRNPPGDYAGRLLEAAGVKGMRVGGAYVWEEHANVIARDEDATSSDVLALARLMRSKVLFRFGVALEPEVKGLVF